MYCLKFGTVVNFFLNRDKVSANRSVDEISIPYLSHEDTKILASKLTLCAAKTGAFDLASSQVKNCVRSLLPDTLDT